MLRFLMILISLLISLVVQAGVLDQHGQHGQQGQHGQAGSMPSGSTGDGQFNPYVAADPQGGFYVLHVERIDKVSNIFIRHTRDGISFSAPVRVNDVPGQAAVRNENPPKMLVGPQGDLYISWGDEREKWKGNIHFTRSTDGGKSFAPALTINSDAALPPVGHAFQSMAIDRKGRIYIAWIDERRKTKEDRGAEIWMAVSEDRGRTFSADRQIISDVCECCRTIMQTDPAGNIFIAYRTVPRAGKMLRDIVVARSTDGGKTFTPTVVSQDGWEINGCPVVGPSMTINRRGSITIAWFVGGGGRPGLYYAVSRDQGRSFSPRRLFIAEQRLGKHSHGVSLADGRTLFAWDDAGENGQTITLWGTVEPGQGYSGTSTGSAAGAQDGPTPKVIGSAAGVSYPVVGPSMTINRRG
ncbi:MAG: sialidase family protein, partial [Acidobacteriota bacterium]